MPNDEEDNTTDHHDKDDDGAHSGDHDKDDDGAHSGDHDKDDDGAHSGDHGKDDDGRHSGDHDKDDDGRHSGDHGKDDDGRHSGDHGGHSEHSGPSSPSGPDPVCFARGTRIRTRAGDVGVENLAIGDEVWTVQNGYQPIKWICAREVPAVGAFAPVHIKAGALGADRDLWVSPEHRMLITGAELELLFDAPKLLVAAKYLVNGRQITRETGMDRVEYYHILFETHQIVQAHGTYSESFFPEASAVAGFSSGQQKELFALFPQLECGQYGHPSAYPSLMAHEIALLSPHITAMG